MTDSRRALDSVLPTLACPSCGGRLTWRADKLVSPCGKAYAVREGTAYFTDIPGDYEQDGNGPNVEREGWSSWRKRNYTYFKEAFAEVPDTARVLDLGAGPGQFNDLLARFEVVVSMDFRAFAPTNVVADLTKPLPLQSASFDLIMASNVLEHIPDTRALLLEVRRVLKPGGLFVATVPFLMRVHQKPYDFNRYTHFQLEALTRQAGFTRISVDALSVPVEVLETATRHFYAAELARAGGVRALALRTLRFLGRIPRALLVHLAGQTPSLDYTEGYGIRAS